MIVMDARWHEQLERDGYVVVAEALTAESVESIVRELETALQSHASTGSIRSKAGNVYAARNILSIFPQAKELWRVPPLQLILRETLGANFGLVRGLYFDKHPDRPWSLPWHKDLTIAVQRNDLPSERFTNPTTKAGVKHVEAPCEILQSMLTLRIHLDDVTPANGPLKVVAGSHRSGKITDPNATDIRTIVCAKGDVLAMRPLLSHSSGNPKAGEAGHRRIIHLEFAADEMLPDGYHWKLFERGVPTAGVIQSLRS